MKHISHVCAAHGTRNAGLVKPTPGWQTGISASICGSGTDSCGMSLTKPLWTNSSGAVSRLMCSWPIFRPCSNPCHLRKPTTPPVRHPKTKGFCPKSSVPTSLCWKHQGYCPFTINAFETFGWKALSNQRLLTLPWELGLLCLLIPVWFVKPCTEA